MMTFVGNSCPLDVLSPPGVECCHGTELDYVLKLLLMVHVIHAILQIHRMQQQFVLASVLCCRCVAVARRAESAAVLLSDAAALCKKLGKLRIVKIGI
jgi:hypothetical protein